MLQLKSFRAARSYWLFRQAQSRKIKELKSKHPELVDAIDLFVSKDPSGKNKYLLWEIKQAIIGFEPQDIARGIAEFHKNIQKIENKDINTYKTLKDLQEVLSSLTKSRREIKEDADKIYDDGRFVVFVPKSMEASCVLGAGTRWCISATDSENYFYQYSQGGTMLYFIVDKKPDTEEEAYQNFYKIAISINLDSGAYWNLNNAVLWDAGDNIAPITSLMKYYGEDTFWDIIFAIAKDYNQREETPIQEIETKMQALENPEEIRRFYETHKSNIEMTMRLSENENTPTDVLKDLIRLRPVTALRRAINHPNFSIPDFVDVYTDEPSPYKRGHLFRVLDIVTQIPADLAENIGKFELAQRIDNISKESLGVASKHSPNVLKTIIDIANKDHSNFRKDLEVRFSRSMKYVIMDMIHFDRLTPELVEMILRSGLILKDPEFAKSLLHSNIEIKPNWIAYLFKVFSYVPEIKKRIAEHKATPLEILEYLAGDKDKNIAMTAISNPRYQAVRRIPESDPARYQYEEGDDIPLSLQPENYSQEM